MSYTALKQWRHLKNFSQDDLAHVSGTSKKAIARIETGATRKPNAKTIERLARALKIKPAELGEAPSTDSGDSLRAYGYRPLKVLVAPDAALAFQAVEYLYGISVADQVQMAPLFATLLALGSLEARRKKLDAIQSATSELLSLAKGHLTFVDEASTIEMGADNEARSIKTGDIFASKLTEDFSNRAFDPAKTNPFAEYLEDLARDLNALDVDFDPDGFGELDGDMPRYRIAEELIDDIAGSDGVALHALRQGYASIRDIPEELLAEDKKEARISWLIARVPAEERERLEAQVAEMRRIFEGVGLSEL